MKVESHRTISFVSFKGGSGRSVSLANVAYQMAKHGSRVGCIDMDIEAGGLHKIFNVDDNDLDSIQHYLMDERDHRYCLKGSDPPDYSNDKVFKERLVINYRQRTGADIPGNIYLIQAKPNAEATAMVDTGQGMFYRFSNLIGCFARVAQLDYVLIDCRSGISNLALPGLAYCDLTAVFLRWGTQHRFGTEKLITWYKKWLRDGKMDKDIIVVASTINLGDVSTDQIETYCDVRLEGLLRGHTFLPEIEVLRTEDAVLSSPEFDEFQERYWALAQKLM